MTGLFGKIFGKKKKSDTTEAFVEELLETLIASSQLDLSFEVMRDVMPDGASGDIQVNLFGADEEMLTAKEGQLLDSIQLFVRRVVQHQLPDESAHINVDSANFREQANEALIALAEKLKEIALTKGKSVYFRALPPKDRKLIHQYLAEDGRVKSRSVGDGHFKKIKIYPVKGAEDSAEGQESHDEAAGTR